MIKTMMLAETISESTASRSTPMLYIAGTGSLTKMKITISNERMTRLVEP